MSFIPFKGAIARCLYKHLKFIPRISRQYSYLKHFGCFHLLFVLFQVLDYLCDAPLLLQLLARGLGTMGGLVWLFLFRVALCCLGTVVSISSPPLDPVSSSSSSVETDPSFCGLLGVLDDMVVVILLVICVININQQMTPESGPSENATSSQGVIGNSL